MREGGVAIAGGGKEGQQVRKNRKQTAKRGDVEEREEKKAGGPPMHAQLGQFQNICRREWKVLQKYEEGSKGKRIGIAEIKAGRLGMLSGIG